MGNSKKDNKKEVAIAGNWGQWSYWGLCSVSCGGGRQYRNRNCDDPPPKNGGEGCEGDDEEEKACNTKACGGGGGGSAGLKKVAVDGNWGQWGDYGTCSKSCDGDRKQRKRQCDDPPVSNGGKECEGLSSEETS